MVLTFFTINQGWQIAFNSSANFYNLVKTASALWWVLSQDWAQNRHCDELFLFVMGPEGTRKGKSVIFRPFLSNPCPLLCIIDCLALINIRFMVVSPAKIGFTIVISTVSSAYLALPQNSTVVGSVWTHIGNEKQGEGFWEDGRAGSTRPSPHLHPNCTGRTCLTSPAFWNSGIYWRLATSRVRPRW